MTTDASLLGALEPGMEFDLTLEATDRQEETTIDLVVADVLEYDDRVIVTFEGADLRWLEVAGKVFVTDSENCPIDADRTLGEMVMVQLAEMEDVRR